MRIFIIARGYPTKQNPQWGCFEKDQALALAKMGHEVVILSYRQHPFIPNLGYQVVDENGIHAVSYNFLPGRLLGQHGAAIRVRFEKWELKKAYLRAVELYGKPDVIYSHYLFISIVALCLRQYNVPIVAIEHWSELNREPMSKHILTMGKNTYPNVQHLITVSTPLQQRIKNVFGVQPDVLYNMVGEEFTYTKSTHHGPMRCITTGSLIYRKGFDMFVKAFAQLNLPKDQWEVTIVGEGPERKQLQQHIDEAGFQDNIHLIGKKSKQEIAKLLNESDVFVLPSRNENFSVAVLEALACGLPVVSSICGGIRECINEKNGLLFEVDSVQGLATCLKHMFYHHQEYNRQAIADDCQARFSSEVIAKQLTEIFEDVINKRGQ